MRLNDAMVGRERGEERQVSGVANADMEMDVS